MNSAIFCSILLDLSATVSNKAKDISEAGSLATQHLSEIAGSLAGKPEILAIGILLIVVAVAIIFFIKKVIINSLLGLIGWAILKFAVGIELPLIEGLIVSVIFGLAGLGAMLVLKFFGIF
ncbi:MAG: hypothetical protein N3F05_02595 [Candidatus Diapherotrites archaeon]|nr:hypothetical protein [Candidatus Diapherotrites archaeon]